MIYTVTLNPSIDFIVRIDKVEIGEVNRMESDDKFAGGKGINVSRILQRLGVDNTATGFIGCWTWCRWIWFCLWEGSGRIFSKWRIFGDGGIGSR